MKYTADFAKLKLDEYKELIKTQNLLPGRKLLQFNLDTNFSLIKDAGIKNLDELVKALSTVTKLKALSTQTKISEDYLFLLKRETGSLQPKPVSLGDFPGIAVDITETLQKAGIRTSKDFFELFTSTDENKQILKTLSISDESLYELFCLCSLCRINGIGAAAAKCFFDAGYFSIDDVADGNASDMLNRLNSANGQSKYYKASLGTKDMQFCIDYARIQKHLM